MNLARQKKCIAVKAAWRFTDVCSVHYQTSRNSTRFARELLNFFAFHRVATAGQVQRFFLQLFNSERSARMHLQTLAAADELAVVRSRGMGAVNIYVITPKGLRRMVMNGRR